MSGARVLMLLGAALLAACKSEEPATVTASCAEGSSIREIDASGQATCEPDDDTQYSAGTGLGLVDGIFHVDDSVVARKDPAAGDQTFDGGILHLDYANDRVGVGTTAPATRLDVAGTVTADDFTYSSVRTGTIQLPYTAFLVNRNDTQWQIDMMGEYIWLNGASQSAFVARLSFPPGATITGLTCYVFDLDEANDFDASGSIAQIWARPYTSTARSYTGFLALLTTTGSANSIQAKSGSNVPHPVDPDSYYSLSVHLRGTPTSFANLRFYGCTVAYTTPGPAY